MYEILFRGKRLDNDEWAYGFLLVDGVTGQHFIFPSGNSCNENDKIGEEGLLRFLAFEVHPGTIGQYTGLTDRNGVKIFEGDIVEGLDYVPEDGGYGVVGFDDGAFEINGNNCLGTFHENYLGEDFEVVGNIYDNPELAGGSRK